MDKKRLKACVNPIKTAVSRAILRANNLPRVKILNLCMRPIGKQWYTSSDLMPLRVFEIIKLAKHIKFNWGRKMNVSSYTPIGPQLQKSKMVQSFDIT